MILPIVGALAAGCIGGALMSVIYDFGTIFSNWLGGLLGGPSLGQRKVTLTGMVVDAAIGCALGALSMGLVELANILGEFGADAGNIADGGAAPVRAGQQELRFLRLVQNTERINLPGGGYRIPDILDRAAGMIGEVKNVSELSYTQQLRDYVAYAKANGLQFDLYVRTSTTLSGPLQAAVDAGDINLFKVLP
jgi:hypothetical protein